MKDFFSRKQSVMMLLLCLFFYQVNAQSSFRKTSAELAKIKMLAAKVEANPSDMKVHSDFFWAHQPEDPAIIDQYKVWTKKYPKNFVVPFAIGKALVDRENPKATPFLLKANSLKPQDAAIWGLLAQDAAIRNDLQNQRIYLQKAAQFAPKNPKYVFDYAYSFKNTNPEKYDSLSIDIARKFPDSEFGVQSLYWLATDAQIPEEKVAYYKQIFMHKANNKSTWYVGAMEQYFDLLLKTIQAKRLNWVHPSF